jgi:hypothetical protein
VTGSGPVGAPFSPPTIQPQSTNPFAKSVPQTNQPFAQPSDQQFQQTQYAHTAPLPQAGFQQQQQQEPDNPFSGPLRSMTTGTNPFAKSASSTPPRPQTSGGLVPQPTGSTNPFRQSQFVNTATGQGWQHNQQAMGGGLDTLGAIPVFPRPAQQQPWQQ